MDSKIIVLNGVNLGLLGGRRPEVYGSQSLQDIEAFVRGEFPDVEWEFHQTDHEGEFIGYIHHASDSLGIILNPGAWTHYSYAIHDALESISIVKVEVHMSNVHRRESWRRESVISPAVDAVVVGMGAFGYRAAASYILSAI